MLRFVADGKMRLLGRTVVIAATLTTGVLSGCGQETGLTIQEGHGSLRLIDVVSSAEIVSPMLGVESIATIDDIDGLEAKEVVQGRLVRNQTTGCRTVGEDENEITCGGDELEALWRVPVGVNSYARISMEINGEGDSEPRRPP
ncbi:MAG: hypothetical protein P8127_07555 [Acidobacteriota bacterium]